MRKLLQHNDLIRKNLMMIFGVGMCLYFSYHLMQGERGYFRYLSLQQQITDMQKESETIRADREHLESRVSMLRSGSIDKDLLEERARLVLGLRHKGERDILMSK